LVAESATDRGILAAGSAGVGAFFGKSLPPDGFIDGSLISAKFSLILRLGTFLFSLELLVKFD
jgi:hypothetical protein